jgi:hypothetical protein
MSAAVWSCSTVQVVTRVRAAPALLAALDVGGVEAGALEVDRRRCVNTRVACMPHSPSVGIPTAAGCWRSGSARTEAWLHAMVAGSLSLKRIESSRGVAVQAAVLVQRHGALIGTRRGRLQPAGELEQVRPDVRVRW